MRVYARIGAVIRAGDGTRTRCFQLGRLMCNQLHLARATADYRFDARPLPVPPIVSRPGLGPAPGEDDREGLELLVVRALHGSAPARADADIPPVRAED